MKNSVCTHPCERADNIFFFGERRRAIKGMVSSSNCPPARPKGKKNWHLGCTRFRNKKIYQLFYVCLFINETLFSRKSSPLRGNIFFIGCNLEKKKKKRGKKPPAAYRKEVEEEEEESRRTKVDCLSLLQLTWWRKEGNNTFSLDGILNVFFSFSFPPFRTGSGAYFSFWSGLLFA